MSFQFMVVDDEQPIVSLVSQYIEMSGNEAVGITNSNRAAALIEQETFDAFIFDVRMASPDGFELTRSTRRSALNRKAPVALLTGYSDVETMKQGFNAGATCLLGKPVSREKIHYLLNVLTSSILLGRRLRARVPFDAAVECHWGALETERMHAKSVNIGEAGMLIDPAGGLAVGQELMVEFPFPPEPRKFRLRARVVRLDSAGRFAVEFLEPFAEAREAIQDYIIARLQG